MDDGPGHSAAAVAVCHECSCDLVTREIRDHVVKWLCVYVLYLHFESWQMSFGSVCRQRHCAPAQRAGQKSCHDWPRHEHLHLLLLQRLRRHAEGVPTNPNGNKMMPSHGGAPGAKRA